MQRSRPPRTLLALAFTPLLALAAGCHSAFIQASVVNHTGQPVHLLEVDYPSASFGSGELANGATFHYRFKVLGSGAAKLTWTDAQQREHTSKGPDLTEGQEGTLTITLGPADANWDTNLSSVSR